MDQQDKSAHTPGPWFADSDGNVWRRPPSDLYQNGGGVAGDKPIATANKGWHGGSEVGYPVEANAKLIAAAPELYEACLTMIAWDDAEKNANPYDDDGGKAWRERIELCSSAFKKARAALAKAVGEQP
ncbi:hypothetical protein K7G19_07430 [Cupriavidus sp. DB3]|uniref:hypothetical protein n=1 Tax=Cupriavidus sp. DB3 TaxID=2873259 RepID=UPI001CF555ED|nr:hypothetical protein [Cupriavidus sp. DB3]MCA7083430.1 hypothetical protein [Cupriavidus sp. DB3]